MYRQPSKRKQLIKRTAIYGLMTTVVCALVVILLLVILGYQYNRSDGRIEQGGLLQLASKPSDATVLINGRSLGSTTATKSTLTQGSYAIEMQKTGYKTWKKTVELLPGTVLWLNYARLIPSDLPSEVIGSFANVASSTVSPNKKWLAIWQDPTSPVFRLEDVADDTVKSKDLEIPASAYTPPAEGKSHSFTLQKWDPQSRYILVKHAFNDDSNEWLVVDTQDMSRTKNVTRLLNIAASRVEFAENNSEMLYVQIEHEIRKVDLINATLSRPLVSNVADFSLFDTTLSYVSVPDATTGKRTAGYYKEGAETVVTVREFADDGMTPRMVMGKYFGDTYIAIAHGKTVEVLSVVAANQERPLVLKTVSNTTLQDEVSYLSFPKNGNSNRFVTIQAGNAVTVYDVELKKTTTTQIKTSTSLTRQLAWIDDYTLASDQDDMLRIYEFDGANQHDIMKVAHGFTTLITPNGKYLYGIEKSESGYTLKRVRLVL